MAEGNLDQIQDRFDGEKDKGYRGARVDPEPNSAYSQESDPMTSPGTPHRPDGRLIEMDPYADPRNEYIDTIYGTQGLDAPSLGGDDVLADLETEVIGPERAPAVGTASHTQTTEFEDSPSDDGVIVSAKITAVATINAAPTNNRTFTLRNTTKSENVFSFTTTTALSAGVETAMTEVVDAALGVSDGDEFSLVETVGGTGQTHGGVDVKFTVQRDA